MSGLVRVGDICASHGTYAASQMATGSSNVLINGVPACKVGDTSTVHCSGPSCHIGTGIVGSGKVLINGSPALRVGDTLSCGSVIIGGSGTVEGV